MRDLSAIATCVLGVTVSIAGYAAAKGAAKASKTVLESATTRTWETYGGRPEGDHYSSLYQINRDNVSELVVAWQF